MQAMYLFLLFLAGALLSGAAVAAVLLSNWLADGGTAGDCSLTMFGNRSGAFWACRAQAALQQNWFPDPIQGCCYVSSKNRSSN